VEKGFNPILVQITIGRGTFFKVGEAKVHVKKNYGKLFSLRNLL